MSSASPNMARQVVPALRGPQPLTGLRPRRAVALSVLLHAAAVVALLSIRTESQAPLAVSSVHVALIAPAPPARRVTRSTITRTPPRSSPRQFRAPVQRAVAVPPAQLAAPLELAIQPVQLPSAQLPRIIAGPPIRTGVLEEARGDAPAAPR